MLHTRHLQRFLLQELIQQLQDELANLRRQLQQHGQPANGVAALSAPMDSVVELNISGSIMTTTRSALQQVRQVLSLHFENMRLAQSD